MLNIFYRFQWQWRCSVGWRLRLQVVVLCKRGRKFHGCFCWVHTIHVGLFNQNTTWLMDHFQRHYLYEQLELYVFIGWLQSHPASGFLSAFSIQAIPAGTPRLHLRVAIINERSFVMKHLLFGSLHWFHDCKVKTATVLPSEDKIDALQWLGYEIAHWCKWVEHT